MLVHPGDQADRWRVHLGECLATQLIRGDDLATCADALARGSVDVVLIEFVGQGARETEVIDVACSTGSVPVVVIADLDVTRRTALLARGVTIVVGRAVSGEELAAQIRSVHDLVTDPPTALVIFRPATMEIETGRGRVQLTDTEWKLLATLHAEPGRFFTAAQLLERVWGHTVGPTSTVSVHIHRLRHKLEPEPDRPVLLVTRRGRGYALVDPNAEQS